MIEPTGYTALDLVGYTDKGTYAANVNYVKNDLVHYGGNIWRVLIDDTIGIMPAEGTNYTLFIGEPTNLVERIIAPLEDNPATVAYQTGRQIIYNDYLYEVIQTIAVGDILIAYEDDPTNANIKLSSPVETQVLALDGRLDTAEADIVALETGKTDTSVIAPVESGTTASRAYAAGSHFIRDSAFCTAKTAIAQGETFTLNTNYTAEDVASVISALNSDISTLTEKIWYGQGSYTGNSGSSTFQFPMLDRRCYLLLGANVPLSLIVESATKAEAKDPITGAALSITANGNYNFTVGGFSWYITPRALGIL